MATVTTSLLYDTDTGTVSTETLLNTVKVKDLVVQGNLNLVNRVLPRSHTHNADEIADIQLPTTLPDHAHPITAVSGLQSTLGGLADQEHGHVVGGVSGLTEALAGKSDVAHKHSNTSVTGLMASLDAKAPMIHTHVLADVVGLREHMQATLVPVTHTHMSLADVSGLQTALQAKSDSTHAHSITEIQGLQAALDAKGPMVHTHSVGDVTDMPATLGTHALLGHVHTSMTKFVGLEGALLAKSDAAHTHSIATITGLDSALVAKSDSVHSHALSSASFSDVGCCILYVQNTTIPQSTPSTTLNYMVTDSLLNTALFPISDAVVVALSKPGWYQIEATLHITPVNTTAQTFYHRARMVLRRSVSDSSPYHYTDIMEDNDVIDLASIHPFSAHFSFCLQTTTPGERIKLAIVDSDSDAALQIGPGSFVAIHTVPGRSSSVGNSFLHPATTMDPEMIQRLRGYKDDLPSLPSLVVSARNRVLSDASLGATFAYIPPKAILGNPVDTDNVFQAAGYENIDDDLRIMNDAQVINNLTFAYLLTDDSRYASRAMTLLDAWPSVNVALEYTPKKPDPLGEQSQAILNLSWGAGVMARCAEYLKYLYPGWASDVETRFRAWMDGPVSTLLKYRDTWAQEPERTVVDTAFFWNDNWGASIYESRLQYAIFKGDNAEVDFVVLRVKKMMQDMFDPLLGIAREFRTRDPAWHGPIGLAGVLQICETLYHQGIDLYSYRHPDAPLPDVPIVYKAIEYAASLFSAVHTYYTTGTGGKWPGVDGVYFTKNHRELGTPWLHYRVTEPRFTYSATGGVWGYNVGDYYETICPGQTSKPPLSAWVAYNHYKGRLGWEMPKLEAWWALRPDTMNDTFHFFVGGTVLTHHYFNS
jgi:hypothetical protein